MLCKAESRNPEHCLKEGRKVTRCAIDLCVLACFIHLNRLTVFIVGRLTKMRDNCGKQWDAHWECLEKRNQEFFQCRQPERKLNDCMFEKLVCPRFPNSLSSESAFQGLRKTIPGSPEGQPQVHEKLHPIYKPLQK